MKSILPAFVLSLISAAAIAQSPVQKQNQTTESIKSQVATSQVVSSVGTLAGGSGGAASASYAGTGKVVTATTVVDTAKNVAERRRVEVLKSNKKGNPNAIAVNPLYNPSGNVGNNPLHNPASRAINESGVSVKTKAKNK